jgi:glycosyltransferase involved in cell wall biosynthesis
MTDLTVCHFYPLLRWGGVEKMLVDLLLHVKQDPIQHTLVTTSSIPEILEIVHQAGILSYQPASRLHYDPSKFWQMARWMRAQNIQIVHSYNAYANAWGNITTLLAGTPALVTGEHGTIWDVRPPLSWLDRWAHRRARLVIANSQASARLLELKYSIPSDKIRIIHNAVSAIPVIDAKRVRESLGLSQNVLVVGSVGRLDTPKDFATFVEAASFVLKMRRDVIFVLVGGGALENELQAYVAELGIQDHFIMTGWRKNASSLIQAFDVFVSTSIRESFGNVLVEAALSGKPVVAPAIDGIPEVVIQNETGILLNPTRAVRRYQSAGAGPIPKNVLINGKFQSPKSLDPETLAHTILYLLAEPELRLHYGQQAKDRAQKLFSMDRYASELENVYRAIR